MCQFATHLSVSAKKKHVCSEPNGQMATVHYVALPFNGQIP